MRSQGSHGFPGSCDILGGNSSLYVITLPILIVAGIMVVGYNILFCHMILQD